MKYTTITPKQLNNIMTEALIRLIEGLYGDEESPDVLEIATTTMALDLYKAMVMKSVLGGHE